MDPLASALFWCIVQVTLVGLLACVLCAALGRGFASGSTIVPAAALAAIVVLTVCIFVPWPSWWRYGPRWRPAAAVSETNLQATQNEKDHLPESTDDVRETFTEEPDVASQSELPLARDLTAGPRPASPLSEPQSSVIGADRGLGDTIVSWMPAGLAGILGLGAVLGLLQLAGGLLSVRSYRRASQPIQDSQLSELVDCLCAELCLTREVELRESHHLATAATVGWTRPVILLPKAWGNWTEDQRRAVLAHELAHVARSDYLACVLAQLSLAIHFYHPLVHWLAARLRLEQELAADATAAELAGGSKNYLQSLAELALHTTERPLGWPAHTFLPTQGTFLRRIEMLRDSKLASPATQWPRWAARWAAVGLLVMGAVLAAGLRGGPAISPFDNQAAAQGQPPQAGGGAATNGIDLTHVVNDAKMLLAIKPEQVLANEQIRKVIEDAKPATPRLQALTMDGLVQITFVGLPGVEVDDWADEPIVVLQFNRKVTIDELLKVDPEMRRPKRVPARAGELAEEGDGGEAYGTPDDLTLILGREDALRKYLANRRKGKPAIAAGDAWSKVCSGAIVAGVDMEIVREQFDKEEPPRGPDAQFQALAPLWKDSEYLAAGIILEGKTLHLRAAVSCSNEELAANVADTAKAAVTLTRNMIRSLRDRERDIPPFAVFLLQTGDGLLKTVAVEQANTLVTAQTSTQVPEMIAATAGSLGGAIAEARSSARRQVSVNNMRQILLAMHNWADAQGGGRLPPPVIMGKDGKGTVPHSWRVELLPYLGYEQLHAAYHFDQPWDSTANKLVLAQMPAQFRHPQDDAKSTNSSYFVLTPEKLLKERPAPGGGATAPEGGFPTAFSAKDGMPFSQVIDGLSNTIAIVEAKSDIPWTKPVDLVFDPTGELPKFGGYEKSGFNIGLCDGAVRFVDSKIDKGILELLIMPQDGTPVPKY
jgi:beta-lactamase regulating signal transducer with metallopeptidase domain